MQRDRLSLVLRALSEKARQAAGLGDYLEQLLSGNIKSGKQDSVDRLLPDYGREIKRVDALLSSIRRMVSAAESDAHAAAEEGSTTLGDFRDLPSDVFRGIVGRMMTVDVASGRSYNANHVRLVCRAMLNAVNAQLREVSFDYRPIRDNADERQTSAMFIRMGSLEKMDMASHSALVPSLRAAAARGGSRLADLSLSVCPYFRSCSSSPIIAQAEISRSLAPVLAQLDGLKSLSFKDLDRGDESMFLHTAACEALAPALSALTRLETLGLGSCWNDDYQDKVSALRALAPALASLVSLRSLDIGCNWFGRNREGFGIVASVLARMTRLTALDLNRNGFEAADVTDLLVPALLSLGNLASLILESNSIDEDVALKLAPGLQCLTSLTHLDLSDNDTMGPYGVAALAPALQNLSKLADLNLSATYIGTEGAVALAPALQRLTNLTNLDLTCNDIGPDGMLALAPALQRLTNLTNLHLRGNHEGAEGRAALAPVLRCLTKLQITRWSPWD